MSLNEGVIVGLERVWKAAAIYEFETAIQRFFSGRTGVKERNFKLENFIFFGPCIFV